MRKLKLGLILFLIVILGSSTTWASSETSTENVTRSYTEPLYRQGLRMEDARLYLNAIGTYSTILGNYDDHVSGNMTPLVQDELAVAVASAYRLGRLTPKYLSGNGDSLVDQLELFQRTHRQIEGLIAAVIRHQGEFSPAEYRSIMSYLVMARGVNLVGWSERLYLAAAWKNYVLMPMPDLIGLTNLGMADIQESLKLDQVTLYDPILNNPNATYPRISRKFYGWRQPLYRKWYSTQLKKREPASVAYKITLLAEADNRPSLAAIRLADERLKYALGPVYYYNSKKSKQILREGAKLNTINQILDDSDFEKLMMDLAKMMGSRH